MSRTTLSLSAVAIAALAACTKREVRDAGPMPLRSEATVLISSDLRGYLAPCGCTSNMRGGIARLASVVAQARAERGLLLYIDAGNTLFADAKLPEAAVPPQERKSRALAAALLRIGLAVHGVGPFDEVRGAAFRSSLGLPDQLDGEVRTLKLGERSIAVVSASEPAEAASLSRRAKEAGADFTLVLLRQPLQLAQKVGLELAPWVDLVVASASMEELSADDSRLVRGAVPVAQIQSKGRSLLRLDLSFAARGHFELRKTREDAERELFAQDARIELLRRQLRENTYAGKARLARQQKLEELMRRKEELASTAAARPPHDANSFTARFIAIEPTIAPLPEVQTIVADYDREVGALNLAWAQEHGPDCPKAPKGQPSFVGSHACQECHTEAFAFWQKTRHASAYRSLEEVGKSFHLECVGCHVTGVNRSGGVCRIDQIAGRDSVGCESCHGPGSFHLDAPSSRNIAKSVRSDLCTTCHDLENSPAFEFERYRERVIGSGHGGT